MLLMLVCPVLLGCMMRKIVTAKARHGYGLASNYVSCLSCVSSKPKRLGILARVSAREQYRQDNLTRQVARLREALSYWGISVAFVYSYVGSGCCFYSFGKAVNLAKYHGVDLFAETVDRYVRNPYYHSELRPHLQAEFVDLEDLKFWADGISLFSLLDPDWSASQIRAYYQSLKRSENSVQGMLLKSVFGKMKSTPPPAGGKWTKYGN